MINNIFTGIDKKIEARLSTVFTGCPGYIVSYNPDTRLASVQSALKSSYIDEDGEIVEEMLPQIDNVPVHFPGGKGWEIVWDIEAGESCWLKFSHSSMDDWIDDGKVAAASQQRRFNLSDAVAEVGLRDKSNAGPRCPPKTLRMGAVDGPQISIDLNTLKISIRSLNEIEIAAGTRVVIDAAEVYIGGQLYEPTP